MPGKQAAPHLLPLPPRHNPELLASPPRRSFLPRPPLPQADFGLSKTLPINKHAEYGYLDSKFRLTGETGAPGLPASQPACLLACSP